MLRHRSVHPRVATAAAGRNMRPFTVSATRLSFDVYDVAAQTLFSHHYRVVDGRLDVLSVPFRFVWPSELDLMARLAGLTLLERWSDWRWERFTSESGKHISVWQKPA